MVVGLPRFSYHSLGPTKNYKVGCGYCCYLHHASPLKTSTSAAVSSTGTAVQERHPDVGTTFCRNTAFLGLLRRCHSFGIAKALARPHQFRISLSKKHEIYPYSRTQSETSSNSCYLQIQPFSTSLIIGEIELITIHPCRNQWTKDLSRQTLLGAEAFHQDSTRSISLHPCCQRLECLGQNKQIFLVLEQVHGEMQ